MMHVTVAYIHWDSRVTDVIYADAVFCIRCKIGSFIEARQYLMLQCSMAEMAHINNEVSYVIAASVEKLHRRC